MVTEKIHGSCCQITYLRESGQVLVTFKGHGAGNLALVETPQNMYWRAVRANGVVAAAARIADYLDADRVGLYGEIYGRSVQDLTYGHTTTSPGFALFDLCVDRNGQVTWLTPAEVTQALAGAGVDLPTAPVLYSGPYDEPVILALAERFEQVSGRQAHLCEGVVVRSATERPSRHLERLILKVVSGAYLTRRGGTEYE